MKNKLLKKISAIIVALFAFFSSTEIKGQQSHSVSQLGKSQQVVSSSQDTMFKSPYVDADEWRDTPVRHHYIHGGFKGTDTRFSFYFPSKEQYQGRFFQYITPVPDSETLSQGALGEGDKIGFSIASGAYFIETNGGGKDGAGMPGSGIDPTIGAYRANAACAQYSRVVAAQMYGEHRTYGYAFGGSGGAYRTIGGFENTEGVWDGAVPYVVGSPMAIPNVFTVRIYAMRVLKDKFQQIADALEPGGGDMYAGLNNEEREALTEVSRMGFPPKAWFAYQTMGLHAFPVLYPGVAMADPKYFKEFWTVPGYLGFNPPESLLKSRIQQTSMIKKAITIDEASKLGLNTGSMPGQARGTADAAWRNVNGQGTEPPVAFQLYESLPDIDFLGGDLIIKTGASAGKNLFIREIKGDLVILGTADSKVLAGIKPGDEVQVDNSNFLAAQTYHRHQVPKSKEYYVWDQFRGSDGNPIYPRRPMQLGPLFTKAASGVLPGGKFKGKMIVLESLWDSEAFPWQADWYRTKVKENLGDNLDDNFRLYFTDHANHADFEFPGDPDHLVSYLGVLQQALRDLSSWVEKGVSPPSNTNYKIVDGQVVVPPTATERKGIQPVIELKANGSERADVSVGKPVTFTATVEVPPHTGKVVAAEWDFEGTGKFPVAGKFSSKSNGSKATLKTTYKFSKPGTYFPVLRVASQRDGDAKTPYARIKNLCRVRVVVK